MKKQTLLMKPVCVAGLASLLFACDKAPTQTEKPHMPQEPVATQAHTAQPPQAENVSATVGKYGSFTKNSTTMPIQDVAHYVDTERNKLHVLLSPAKLSEEERSKFAETGDAMMLFFDNETPDASKWKWFPYGQLDVFFKSADMSADNIKGFYMLAYGIEKPNFTDNINASPDDTKVFKTVSMSTGKLQLEASGTTDIGDDKYAWQINIP